MLISSNVEEHNLILPLVSKFLWILYKKKRFNWFKMSTYLMHTYWRDQYTIIKQLTKTISKNLALKWNRPTRLGVRIGRSKLELSICQRIISLKWNTIFSDRTFQNNLIKKNVIKKWRDKEILINWWCRMTTYVFWYEII